MGESTIQMDPLAAQMQYANAQGAQMQQPQQPAVTAGQPTQQVIVPTDDWEKYLEFMQQQCPPGKVVTAVPISDEAASAAVAEGNAIQITKKNFMGGEGGQAAAFDAQNMIGIADGNVPQFIENLAQKLGEFAAKNNGSVNVKGENKMENNNNQNQAVQMGMLDQLKAQADNVSWGRIAKGAGLVGGGVVIGKFVFGGKNADPEAAAALMNAAETMSKADPKAIASAIGTVAKAGLSKIFGM